MGVRLLRNALAGMVPPWLANRAGLNTGYKVLYTVALLGDTLIETSWEGLLATFPGVGTLTALDLHAQSRGLLQGPNEPDASFVQRLIAWLVTWEQAGSAEILAQQIQIYMIGQGTLGTGVMPVVRIVDRNGNWVIANSDGTITTTSAPFDWDETLGWVDDVGQNPGATVSEWWSDMWIVIAPPTGSSPIYPLYTSTSDPAWLANFNGPKTLACGHQAPLNVVNGIDTLIATWKGAHVWIRCVIWPGDSTSFSPSTPTADGTFGNFSKNVGGTQVQGRNATARYHIPPNGG
jgi:hypothetical protein